MCQPACHQRGAAAAATTLEIAFSGCVVSSVVALPLPTAMDVCGRVLKSVRPTGELAAYMHVRMHYAVPRYLPSCALWQITKLHNTPQCTEFWFWPSYGRIGDGGAVVSRGGRCPPGEHRSTKCSSSIPSFCSRFLLNVGGNEWVHCIQREYFSAHPG